MADKVAAGVRSRMMSKIRSRDTKPELAVRRFLHANGLRFRLHYKALPGRPDLVLPKWNVVVFVDGCFWHGHDGCRYFRVPGTRKEFWVEKIATNVARDAKVRAELRRLGWRVIVVWECALRDNPQKTLSGLLRSVRSGLS